MPTRNISLTDEQESFVEQVVRVGEYQNASEVMRDAVQGVQRRVETDNLKLNLLRVQLSGGLYALERGNLIEVDDVALDAALDNLAAPTR